MKYRIPTRNNPNFTDYLRDHTVYKLRAFNRYSIYISYTHHTGHRQRVNYTILTHKRSIPVFLVNIHSYQTWDLFQLPQKNPPSMNFRGSNLPGYYNSSIYGLCAPLRANILLRSHSNHENVIIIPVCRRTINHMVMGRLLCFATNLKPYILPTLYCTPSSSSTSFNPSNSSA